MTGTMESTDSCCVATLNESEMEPLTEPSTMVVTTSTTTLSDAPPPMDETADYFELQRVDPMSLEDPCSPFDNMGGGDTQLVTIKSFLDEIMLDENNNNLLTNLDWNKDWLSNSTTATTGTLTLAAGSDKLLSSSNGLIMNPSNVLLMDEFVESDSNIKTEEEAGLRVFYEDPQENQISSTLLTIPPSAVWGPGVITTVNGVQLVTTDSEATEACTVSDPQSLLRTALMEAKKSEGGIVTTTTAAALSDGIINGTLLTTDNKIILSTVAEPTTTQIVLTSLSNLRDTAAIAGARGEAVLVNSCDIANTSSNDNLGSVNSSSNDSSHSNGGSKEERKVSTTTTTAASATSNNLVTTVKWTLDKSKGAGKESVKEGKPAGKSATNGSSSPGITGGPRSLHYCSVCNKGFKDKYSVNVHIRTHTGEKPFACNLCAKHFRQKAHLAKHLQTHAAKKQKKLP